MKTNRFTIAAAVVILLLGGAIYVFSRRANPGEPTKTDVETLYETTAPAQESVSDKTVVKVYFAKTGENDCAKVYPLNREIIRTPKIGAAALGELFKGPSQSERGQGYTSIFFQHSADILIALRVKDKIGYVDIKDVRQILSGVSASCGSAQFLAAVTSTLKQFPTVNSVLYALGGSAETFYDWVQIGCNEQNRLCENAIYKTDLVIVSTPTSGELIRSPLTVRGQARGGWYFEASFPLKVVDQNGQVIGQGLAQTSSNWMVDDFVPFTGTVTFSAPTTQFGAIIFEKDNPSGLPEHADSTRLFIRLKN